MVVRDLTDEALTDAEKGLFDELDKVQLKPSRLWGIIKPTLWFIIPGSIIAVFTGIFFEPVLLVYFTFVFGIFLAACGVMFFVALSVTRLSSDKKTYSFTKNGFVVQSNDEIIQYFPWEEITDVEITGKGEGNRIPRICTVKTESDEVVIRIGKFYESSDNVVAPDHIVDTIELYYEKKKKN